MTIGVPASTDHRFTSDTRAILPYGGQQLVHTVA